jgi:uncharacterized protein (TIGR00369 family)
MPSKNKRLDYLMADAVQGFTEHLGLISMSMEPGHFVSRLPIKKHHLQQDGFVHAGVIATLADHTAGYASYSLVAENLRILTIEYKITFLKPAKGEYLECRAKVIKPGKRILIAESEVFEIKSDEENLIAKALLTMAAVPKEKLIKT